MRAHSRIPITRRVRRRPEHGEHKPTGTPDSVLDQYRAAMAEQHHQQETHR